MFYNYIRRNSYKTRKENGIYFTSLIVSIIAFYVILSLGEQDVMLYLKTIESTAVSKLLLLIPLLYAISLFFVFFLVYFANKYQLHLRSREFGLYLMMGMKRSKLFAMLIGETLWNGLIALIIGIPIALFLTEMISLASARLIGMNIIGHQFSISWEGLSLTIIGFIIVQIIAVMILSFRMARREPIDFLHEQKRDTQKTLSPLWGSISLLTGTILFLGALFLGVSYSLAVLYLRDFHYIIFALILFTGIIGTFILFRGLGSLIGLWIKRKGKSSKGLFIFTGRQLQENVLSQWGSLAIASLLILMAMISFVYGAATALNNNSTSDKTVDFTFYGSEKEIVSMLSSDQLALYVQNYYPMKLSNFYPSQSEEGEEDVSTFTWSGFEATISKQEASDEKENLLDYLSYQDRPYLISLTSYNQLLHSINQQPIQLEDDEMALYSNEQFSFSHDLVRTVLKENPTVSIEENPYTLKSKLYTHHIVADRAITLSYALIVPDDVYDTFTSSYDDSAYWNLLLTEDFVKEKGLMQAMYEVDTILRTIDDVQYESYLASMGRQLFYVIAGSYTTFYLGIMFLIIANTVLGLTFLMQQKSTMHRYTTAVMVGASVEALCKSARTQIWLYFGLVITVAFVSSVFGIWSMMTAFPTTINMTGGVRTVIFTLIMFILFELGYVTMIVKKSDQEIQKIAEFE